MRCALKPGTRRQSVSLNASRNSYVIFEILQGHWKGLFGHSKEVSRTWAVCSLLSCGGLSRWGFFIHVPTHISSGKTGEHTRNDTTKTEGPETTGCAIVVWELSSLPLAGLQNPEGWRSRGS